jgi:hypothetical protein
MLGHARRLPFWLTAPPPVPVAALLEVAAPFRVLAVPALAVPALAVPAFAVPALAVPAFAAPL